MKITSIDIHNFKNIPELSWSPSHGINGIFGNNGQGKTNLLDAVYCSLKGTSFRPYVQKIDWLKNNENSAFVLIKVSHDLGIKNDIKLIHSSNKWKLVANQKNIKISDVCDKFSVVSFSPDDHELVRGSPDLRRSFMDNIFVDIAPGYKEILARFNLCLKNRNAFLKKIKKNQIFNTHILKKSSFYTEFLTWNEVFAKQSLQLWKIRKEILVYFERTFYNVLKEFISDWNTRAFFRYVPKEPYLWQNDLFDDFDYFFDQLILNSTSDFVTGWSHIGPHRDDFFIELDNQDMRRRSSQGQARLIAMLLKWVHLKLLENFRKEPPIFLIDDFSSELDKNRRNEFLRYLIEKKAQVFLTATEEPSGLDLNVDFSSKIYLKKGQIYEDFSGEKPTILLY